MSKARTNIQIDDSYVRTIMDRYGVHTKTEAVDLATFNLGTHGVSGYRIRHPGSDTDAGELDCRRGGCQR